MVGVTETVSPDVDRARAGDDAAFTRLVGPLRAELHSHCYRMLGSSYDADDAVQEALLRAWRGFARFEGRSSLRTWLYTVATRTCLDLVAQRGKRALPVDLGPSDESGRYDGLARADVAWLGPYPDAGVAQEARESVELAFVAALQHLPGNQRAALLLFDVLGFSVAEIAEAMDTSSTAVNSALARARKLVAERVPESTQQHSLRRLGDARLAAIATAYADALQRGDAAALLALVSSDVTWSMPPLPHWYRGAAAVVNFAQAVPMRECGAWRHRLTTANGQPAVGLYRQTPDTEDFVFFNLTVLGLRGDRICEITSFLDPGLFALFGLPGLVGAAHLRNDP
ncbi:MAG: sigma-70 family RNA polymerase sigma factor [Mycobacteriaceae bacterium]|nr:sigma-70 family RNA polymerase sigma factor [Mycobacteriaceae bacterium]